MERKKLISKPVKRLEEFAWEIEDAGALQALSRGEALPHQQKRALEFIIHSLCGTYDMHYHDNERSTTFALGRAFPGQQIVMLLKRNLSALMNTETKHG